VIPEQIKPRDQITLEHPNGDRLGWRRVELERGPGGTSWLVVTRVGDVDPTSANARHNRSLANLLRAGWRITAARRG
jgi:hypothetical protein